MKFLRVLFALAALGALGLLGPWRQASASASDQPPRLEVAGPAAGAPMTFIVYGDTRFTQRSDVVNAVARRALVARIANESPVAILIGGDLVYTGTNEDDYETYKSETREWTDKHIPVFVALGNHEFRGCEDEVERCLGNWWKDAAPAGVRPFRWYSVTLGPAILAVILDSDAPLKPGSEQHTWFERQISSAGPQVRFILVVLHYPPVRDPFYRQVLDEKEVARYLSKTAASFHAQFVVIGSHVHNYERYRKKGVTYLVSGGGGAKPVPAIRLFGELSKLRTGVNFHYIRFVLQGDTLRGTMVRFDAGDRGENPWSEPDRFEIQAKQ
jgi:calcineurin-like phosphoesterase family protein